MHNRGQWIRYASAIFNSICTMKFGHDPVYPVFLTMISIKAQLKLDHQENEQTNRDPYSQTSDIDNGEILVSRKISPGDFEIIFDHGSRLSLNQVPLISNGLIVLWFDCWAQL